MNTSNIKTIRHAVQAFRMYFEDASHRPSSSMAYPSKLIYFFLRSYRNRVSYEDIKSKSIYDLNVELTIPCISLEKADKVDCPCAPASGCTWQKSVHTLPKMLRGVPNSVTLLLQNKNQPNYGTFSYVDWYNFQDKINGRFPAQGKELYYTLKNVNSNRHLYIYSNNSEYPNLKAVALSAVFNDPLEVAEFPVCGKKQAYLCSPMDEEFIIEDEIQAKVFELTFNALMGFRNAQHGTDILNNENNDTLRS